MWMLAYMSASAEQCTGIQLSSSDLLYQAFFFLSFLMCQIHCKLTFRDPLILGISWLLTDLHWAHHAQFGKSGLSCSSERGKFKQLPTHPKTTQEGQTLSSSLTGQSEIISDHSGGATESVWEWMWEIQVQIHAQQKMWWGGHCLRLCIMFSEEFSHSTIVDLILWLFGAQSFQLLFHWNSHSGKTAAFQCWSCASKRGATGPSRPIGKLGAYPEEASRTAPTAGYSVCSIGMAASVGVVRELWAARNWTTIQTQCGGILLLKGLSC